MSLPRPPRCWNGQHGWEEWNSLNKMADDTNGKSPDHYCTDCTPEYQAQMKAAGRCEHPEVKFVQIVERYRRRARKETKTNSLRGVHSEKAGD